MATTRPATANAKRSFILPKLIHSTSGSQNPHRRKKKKMNTFKRIIKAWLFDGQDYADRNEESYPTVSHHENVESRSFISFKVHAASGGYVVEHRYHNVEEDRYVPPKLTIINSDEDVGKRLKEIIFMESINS